MVNLPNVSPQEAEVYHRLRDDHKIKPEYYFQANPKPVGGEAQAKYYEALRNDPPEKIQKQYHEGTIRQNLTYFREQNVSPTVAYDNLKARGLIDKGATPPEKWDRPITVPKELPKGVSVEKLNREMGNLEAQKKEGLGEAAGRNKLVTENTERIKITEGWIAQSGMSRAEAEGTLAQLKPPLMEDSRPTKFPIEAGRSALFAKDGAGKETAKKPGAKGAEELTAANKKYSERTGAMSRIQTQFNEMGIKSDERQAILGAQTSLGGPLTDERGNLRDGVSQRQLETYEKALKDRTETSTELQSKADELKEKLTKDGKQPEDKRMSEGEREILNSRIERLEKRVTERRETEGNKLREEAADFYRGNLPSELKKYGLKDDEIVHLMNGRGHLGDSPDLGALAADYHDFGQTRSPQEKSGIQKDLRKEIQTGGGSYGKPTGDSPAARRGQDVIQGLSRQGGYAQGRGGAGGQLGDQMSLEDQRHENQMEQMLEQNRLTSENQKDFALFQNELAMDKEFRDEEGQKRAEKRMEQKELRMKEVDFDYNKRMATVQAGWNMFSQAFGAVFNLGPQALMSTFEAQNRRLEAETQRTPLMAIQQGIANSLYPGARA